MTERTTHVSYKCAVFSSQSIPIIIRRSRNSEISDIFEWFYIPSTCIQTL